VVQARNRFSGISLGCRISSSNPFREFTMQSHISAAKVLVSGPAGHIEVLIDQPADAVRGIAVVGHPHPLLGGNAEHKVPALLARIFHAHGFLVARPNFRGAGNSEGSHDEGIGETDDMFAVLAHLRSSYPDAPLGLAGFSFGAYVIARVAAQLRERGQPCTRLILSGMPAGAVAGRRSYDTPAVDANALVVHGEADDRVPLLNVMDWARPQELPVVVVPGGNHFFTGKLKPLQRIVEGYLAH
jgi:alpha/beta superfamily hydrolase